MSSLYQSGAQMSMEEVVPAAAAVRGLTRSSILTQRRRVRIQAQGGRDYGTGTGATAQNGGNQQIQFLLSDAGGLVDPASICLVYNFCTDAAVPDDGHPFTRVQISLNGQLLDDVNSAAKNTNAEVNLGATKDWYSTSGSFCGFELLNNDLNTGLASIANAAALQQYSGAWGDVSGNWVNIEARYDDAFTAANPLGGVQRCLPLGLISGVGRMKNYLPLSILGELSFTFFTGSPNEVLFTPATGTPNYCLKGVYLLADIVIPHPAYAEVLSRMANEGGEGGLSMPYESTIVSQAGVMTGQGGSPSLVDYSIVVSRATNNLVRSIVWFQPNARLSSVLYPIQSMFNHAGVNKIQWRVGSQFYPSIPAEGDADIWAMSASAYGTAGLNEQNGVANSQLWRQTTPAVLGQLGVREGSVKFDYADKFTPAYGFRVVKGAAEEIQMDGVSLAGASGSQLVVSVTAAPVYDTAPFVSLVATRVIQASNGQVRVLGA